VIVVGALLVGLVLAGVLALVDDQGESTRTPQGGRAPTNERAPEAEDHRAGELPDVEAAARRFLAGYLPLIYGEKGATVDELRSASPQLIASLRAAGARVTPAQAERTPRLQRVTVIQEGSTGALATAQIKDSAAAVYPLVFHMQRASDGWVVTRIGGP
jgi:hypothetical protein